MSSKGHQQLLGLLVALVVIAAGGLVLLFQSGQAPPETTLVLSQTAIALPGEARFEDGRHAVRLEAIPGDTERVRVRVTGPDGVIDEWEQGLERKSYTHNAWRYFVDVLSISDDETKATDTTVSVSREL